MAGLDGAGTAGLVSVAAGVSVLVAAGSVVFFFLEKKAFNFSRGESVGASGALASCTSGDATR